MSEGAKTIFVLFGDIRDRNGKPLDAYARRLREAYDQWKPKLAAKGYNLGYGSQPYASKQAFLFLLGDDSCHAMIWHSHGNALGQLSDVQGLTISPSDIKKVSKNLQFAALWGCDVGRSGFEWRRVLGLNQRFPQDSQRRLAAQWVSVASGDYDLGPYAVKPAPLQFVETNSRFIGAYYNFPKWIELLPKGEL